MVGKSVRKHANEFFDNGRSESVPMHGEVFNVNPIQFLQG
jgi:hypothetical protein